MNNIWSITLDEYLDEYLDIVELARKDGCKPGESMEKYVEEYMKEKNRKPTGMTELTKEEMVKEQASHGKNVMSMETDERGNTKYKFTKGENK